MREKSPRLAEPLRAEALLLRGEDVRTTNPCERQDLPSALCTTFDPKHVQTRENKTTSANFDAIM
ncbi:hypothetical protein HMPREF1578_01023 [Gardnerella pickettii JCP8017B]|nr:hypothetical protein HMPREF1578_01023 [Gardnerella pickettii JCP8017B]